MTMKFDVRVLSLADDEESRRRRALLRELEDVAAFTLFDAIDGRSADPALVARHLAANHKLHPGQIGCALSHLQLWSARAAGRTGADEILVVLEDDAVFEAGWLKKIDEVVGALAAKGEPWDLLFLGHCAEPEGELIATLSGIGLRVRRSFFPRGSFGYAVSPEGLQTLVAWATRTRLELPIDVELARSVWGKSMHGFSIFPPLVTVRSGPSTVTARAGGLAAPSLASSDGGLPTTLPREFAALLRRLKVKKLLELPCGDYARRRAFVEAIPGLAYIGCDASAELVARNRTAHAGRRTRFENFDPGAGRLPRADLLLCLDLLPRLSVTEVYRFLRNVARSDIRYFATATQVDGNADIDPVYGGGCRPLNLQAAPYLFPEPLTLFHEGAAGAARSGQVLAVWSIDAVRASLADSDRTPARRGQSDGTVREQNEEIHLLGVTEVGKFIDRVCEMGVSGPRTDRTALAETWRNAAAVFESWQKSRPGQANDPQVLPIDESMQKHVDALVRTGHIDATFSKVPVAFGMVELDTLIVTQHHLDVATLRNACATLPDDLAGPELAEFCLPLSSQPSKFRVSFDDGKRFYFHSDSHDCRFLGAQILDPQQINDLSLTGHAAAVVAISIGYSTNILNVIRYGNRMVLNNGYHRAFALRARGHTHAPCLIQVCSNWDDLCLVSSSALVSNPNPYLTAARPPILRDFFDRRVTTRYAAHRVLRQIRVSYDIESIQIKAPEL